LYLLFSEGYYSSNPDTFLRKDLTLEALRLLHLLIENEKTNTPPINALMALMCFQSSSLAARTKDTGEVILYQDQDKSLWNDALIAKGEYYLNRASTGKIISKYHLEAGIAFWHTRKTEGN
jgi:predicted RNA polymerase sigma factor